MRPCVVVCVLLCGAAGVCAQSSPAFEAVSVKPSPPWQPGLKAGVTFDETHFSAHFMTMQSLIISAYDLPAYSIVGMQRWFTSAGFDIEATMPPGTTKEQIKPMMQSMLADRFGMKAKLDGAVRSADHRQDWARRLLRCDARLEFRCG